MPSPRKEKPLSPIPEATENGAPVGAADLYVVPAGDTTIVFQPGVLANDSDPDGDPLFATIVAPPSNGAFSLDVFGGFDYTPATGFAGMDSLSYRAFDGTDWSDPVTVTIEVERIEVAGTARNNRLRGTAEAEIFRPGGGANDQVVLGGGMDVVAVGDTAMNGRRDTVRIEGFGADDALDLGGAEIASARKAGAWLRLTLTGDGDHVLLRGVALADLNLI